MFIDEVEIILKAGHGGPGRVSFNPGRYGGPNGGNGGKGGNIWASVTSDLSALNQFARKKEFEAEDGESGGSNKRSGKDGKDVEFEFPIGTSLINEKTGEVIELDNLNKKVLICKGGLGGLGNYEFRSSTNTTPQYAQPGLYGEEKHFKVTLKLIASFGLIGLPNAGKSSLLNELTKANVKVASYPFTTLEPNLGALNGKIIADIPGLIEGAHTGKGLGIRFLKHIEKVPLLLHCISSESENAVKDYQAIRNELGKFDEKLLEKPEIILITKTDLVDQKQIKEVTKKLGKFKKEIVTVSIHDWDSLQSLKNKLTS